MLATSGAFATAVAGVEYYGAWRVQITLPTSENLCSNGTFESDTSGWAPRTGGNPSTLAVSTAQEHSGSQSLLSTSAGASFLKEGPVYLLATTIGTVYTATGWVYVPTGTPAALAFLVGGTTGTSSTVTNAWQQISVTFTATATSTQVCFGSTPSAGGQTFYVDDVVIQPAGLYQDVTLAVSQVQVTAATTTDMPEGSRLEVGYPAISCDFTVSGLVDPADASKTAGWLFGPYSTTSPLYRSDVLYAAVTVDFGVYTPTSGGVAEWVRKFTGVVDSYTVSEDGAVAFTCVDAMRAKLRSVPAAPAVITTPPINAGLTSEYAIDALLRAATAGTVSTWPARRAQCVLAAGMRSSQWPEVGTMQGAGLAQFAPGIWGTAFGTLSSSQAVSYTFGGAVQRTFFFEFWTDCPTATGQLSIGFRSVSETSVSVNLQSGVLTVTAAGGSFSTIAVTGANHYVAVLVNLPSSGTTWTGTAWVDGASTSIGGTGGTYFNTVPTIVDVVTVNATMEAFQVTNEAAPASNNGFTPKAILDPSLNTLTVVPEIAAGDPFTVIQQIADAELGHAGGDEAGIFRFYNRNTIHAVTSVRDITSAASLTALGNAEISAAGVINRATVEYTPWSFATANTTVWSSTSPVRVAKASTKTLTVTSDGLFASVGATFTNLANNSTNVTSSHYRASTDKYGTTEHPGVTITAVQTSPTTAVLTMVNPTNQDAWLVSPANYTDVTVYPVGTPVLQLAGLVVTQGETLTQDLQYPPAINGGAASSRFGEQATQISGNAWMQDDDSAYLLASDIVVDQTNPRPNLTGVEIVPDPRIQLVDVVHLLDPDRTGVDEYVRVFGWTITWEAAGDATSPMRYDMTLDARTVAAPGGWIMGVAGRSEIGSTAYVYPST